MGGPEVTGSLRAVPVTELAARVLESIVGRFGLEGGPEALVELGLLRGRSALRYRSAAVLPVRQWHLLHDRLRERDGDRAAALFPDHDLARIGAALHQQVDEAEAAHRDLPRATRLGARATPAAVDAVGERLLAGARLDGEELLLVPRYVRAHTTPRGLRSRGAAAVHALRTQLEYSENAVDDGHDVLVREALRNLDAGPAAEAAVDVLLEIAAEDVCPCRAARELLFVDSDRGRGAVASFFATHRCARHEWAVHAGLTYRLREPLELLREGPALGHDVQVTAAHYLAQFVGSPRPSPADRILVARLLQEVREELGEFSEDDRAAVESAQLCDRAGTPLDDDPAVPWLWRRMLLGTGFAESGTSFELLRNLGVAPETWLVRLVRDSALSVRLRVKALDALRVFGSTEAESVLRTIASDSAERPSVRVQALWSYTARGADTGWMYALLADPCPEVREALIYAARQDCVGVVLAGTADANPEVARLALQEVRRLAAAGRLGPLSVADP